jgi:hypothetical protein
VTPPPASELIGAGGAPSAETLNPIFICGCQRSGTTVLAVMLDRHSRIAVPRETQFFCGFERQDRRQVLPMTHGALVGRAMENYFISRVGVAGDELLDRFQAAAPTYPNLLRALLIAYCRVRGKQRPGEKSCNHLFYADEILRTYPDAKMICILRDGRDTVRSLLNVVWGRGKPVAAHCHTWNSFARQLIRCQRRCPPQRFAVVRYEDLMIQPERELRRLCEFLGETFEPSQLDESLDAGPVQEVERQWKAKARNAPDPGRVAAWRTCEDRELIARMNLYMGPLLRRLNYPDSTVTGASPWKRLGWHIAMVPYWRPIFPIALRVNWALKFIRKLVRPDSATSTTAAEPVDSDDN